MQDGARTVVPRQHDGRVPDEHARCLEAKVELGGELPQDIWMHGALPGWIFVNRYRAGVPESGSAHNGTAIGDSGPGVAGLPPVAAAPPAACVPPAAADGPGILLRL